MKNKRGLIIAIAVVLVAVQAVGAAFAVNAAQNREITVDFNNIISDDFKGVGSNLWAGSLTELERSSFGTNEANFALHEKRISTIEPGPMRMLVTPNFIVDMSDGKNGEENWKNGIYDFTTGEMYTLEKYCETFKASGTEIQINFGAAVKGEIADWFPIKDTSDVLKAAPADLEAFAKAAVAVIQYLWSKGYDNVKYLSFYNEANGNNFQSFGDEREYWVSMLERVHNAFKEAGIRDKIKIIGTELTADTAVLEKAKDWLQYVHENGHSASGEKYYDILSAHLYMTGESKDKLDSEYLNSYETIVKFLGRVRKVIGDDELWVTEFTWNSRSNDTSFRVSQASVFLACVNSGVSSTSNWFLLGTMIPTLDSAQNGTGTLWNYPKAYDRIWWAYEEMGLLMRYVPKHSRSVTVTESEDDMNAAAFISKDGKDITVVVETDDNSTTRNLKLNLGSAAADKTFRKHSMTYPANKDMDILLSDGGNAILPTGEKTLTADANGVIEDENLSNSHQLIIYTTMEEEKQVRFETSVARTVKSGETVDINVEEVIASDSNDVNWSVYSCYTPDKQALYEGDASFDAKAGTINQNGVYSAVGVAQGTEVAVKATTKDGSAYGIVYITVS